MTGTGGGDGSASSSAPGRRRRPEPTPVQRALGLLTRREHSRRELTRKLAARGVEAEAAEQAVVKLAEAGWQDDRRFAESLVRARGLSGYGPRYIRAELGTHGLGGEIVEAALAGFDGDWAALAHDLVRRRQPAALGGDAAARRKAADLLLRRGFSMEHVQEAMRTGDGDH